jgi:hypothetical protein
VVLNTKYALTEDSWAPFYGANTGAIPPNRWVDLTGRTRHAVSIRRGRQYELDQIQAGEYSTTLDNTDGSLDPLNATGPWTGIIRPYQPYRRRLMYSPKVNLLSQSIATGGDGWAQGYNPASSDIGVYSNVDPTGGIVAVLGAGVAYEETSVFQYSIASGSPQYAFIAATDHTPAVAPGQPYTISMYCRNVTPGTTVSIAPAIGWYSAMGTNPSTWSSSNVFTLTGSATAPWTQVQVSGVAPANTTGCMVGVTLSATTTAALTFQTDGWQFEKGTTATPWVYPGYWYSIFSGFVERWPSQYADGGSRGEVVPTAVDSFALLAQCTLTDPLTAELNGLGPRFVYKLDDPAGATFAADSTGNYPGLTTVNAKTGAGSLTFGNAITATNTTTGVYADSKTVCSIANWQPGTLAGANGNTYGGATMLSLDAAGITGPTDPKEWTRILAFRYTGPAPTDDARIWSSFDSSNNGTGPAGADIDVMIQPSGTYLSTGSYSNPYGPSATFATNGTVNPCDGNWHLAVFGMSYSQGLILGSLDGASGGFTSAGWSDPSQLPYGITCDTIGGWRVKSLGNIATFNFKGDLSYAAEIPYLLTQTQINNLYSAWRKQCSGESTGTRYARILRYAGYTGGTWIDGGNTSSMGAANDLDGTDALSALQAVVDTESGAHWVQGSGTIRFRGRTGRYNQLTPAITLGEGAGETPYEDCQLDYDATHLANIVQVTQQPTGQVFTAQDQTSITNYMPRLMTRTLNTTNALECQDAANYLLSRYKNPLPRVTAVKVNLSGNQSSWGEVMGVELGSRIRVMRRPNGAPPIQVDCFIEQIQWDFDDNGGAFVTFQCSPADKLTYGQFAGWHTTLAAATSVGDASITVNAPADNVNPIAAQIGVGQKLVVGLGGPVPETMTVAAVQFTSPGWTTAVIALTAPMAHSHTNGFLVGEPLPSAANSDPTTYDLAAALDSTAFAY